MPPRVVIPTAHEDHPARIGLAGAAFASAAAGIVAARLLAVPVPTSAPDPRPAIATAAARATRGLGGDDDSSASLAAASEEGEPRPPEGASVGDVGEVVVGEGVGGAGVGGEVDDDTPDEGDAIAARVDEGRPLDERDATGPTSADRDGTRARRTLARGRVAYLRCDGVPPVAGPYPCPRDPGLEEAAWRALEGAPGCPALSTAGEADVLLVLRRGDAPEVRTRDTFRGDVARLDPDAVTSCVGPALAQVTQHLGASHLVVSFRFALR